MTDKISRLLVTTDLSEDSLPALDLANELCKALGARATLLTALDFDAELPPGVLSLSPSKEQALREQLREHVGSTLNGLVSAHFDAGVRTDVEIVEGGGAANAICDYARKTAPDLLLMATHGRSGVSHLFLGSVAERVLRTATCPVLTVKSR